MSFSDELHPEPADERPWLSGESCHRCCDPVLPEQRRVQLMPGGGVVVVHPWCLDVPGRLVGADRCDP